MHIYIYMYICIYMWVCINSKESMYQGVFDDFNYFFFCLKKCCLRLQSCSKHMREREKIIVWQYFCVPKMLANFSRYTVCVCVCVCVCVRASAGGVCVLCLYYTSTT